MTEQSRGRAVFCFLKSCRRNIYPTRDRAKRSGTPWAEVQYARGNHDVCSAGRCRHIRSTKLALSGVLLPIALHPPTVFWQRERSRDSEILDSNPGFSSGYIIY